MRTRDYKVESEIIERKMPKVLGNNQFSGKTIVALDGGYSSVKGVSGNWTFRFPSYAKKISESMGIIGNLSPNDILFRDNKTNTLWAVGSLAESLIEKTDVEQLTDNSLFSRYHYQSDIFRVVMSTGLAIGLLDTPGNNDIYVQTGLPTDYLTSDKDELISVLAGEYDFSIKIGNAEYRRFHFTLPADHVWVMEQPKGTLLASAYDKNGDLLPNAKAVLSSNTIIYDIGFGTEDIYAIRSGMNNGRQTYNDTGMRAVFEETIKEICTKNKLPMTYKIFEFQKFLKSGEAVYFNRQTLSSEKIEFAEILDRINRNLCEKSVHRLLELYDNLLDYQNLVVTGGTGESRYEQIKDMLKGLTHLHILPGNQSDESLPFSYSNVIGYYMSAYLKLKKELSTKSENK